jgi:transcriptional regulator with XRE-family HTH domain
MSLKLASVLRGKPINPSRERFRQCLTALGWSGAEVSRRLGTHVNTVTWWMTKGEPPKYAMAYLDLALEVKRLAASLDAAPRKRSKS